MAADSDAPKLAALRELLPATGAGIYLDTATLGPLPAESAAAMREADDWELRVGRVWAGRGEDVAQRAEEARAVVAALLGADPGQILLTHGRGDAVSLARQLTADRGGRVVDVTHLAGAQPVAVTTLAADAVALAADRWLLGPEGTGAVWLAEPPAADTVRRELPRTALIGLARSLGWLEMYVGLDWIYTRTAQLAARLHEALAGVPGLELLTPRPELVATLAFRLREWPAQAAADELAHRVQALVRPLDDGQTVQASVAWFNTEAELDRFAGAAGELAAHTPATLPRRPSLIVLNDE
jgi:selenocysteine lyase/cysteine desulfurase